MAVDRKEWNRLLDRLDLTQDSSLQEVLESVHEHLNLLEEKEIAIEELEDRIGDLENKKHPPDDEAARLVHAQHDSSFLLDLSLCPHPDCTRLWHE